MAMKRTDVVHARFVKSSAGYADSPAPDKPEFAFIGRSNVGKSSLINMLANHKALARVSATPGKTININHYLINQSIYWVDLPGYGYARRSRSLRELWEKTMQTYFVQRENLMIVFVLIDSRLKPQASDLSFIQSLGEHAVPLAVVFTKTDKNSKHETARNITAFKSALLEDWEELPPMFQTSSEDRTGRDELLKFIFESAKLFRH